MATIEKYKIHIHVKDIPPAIRSKLPEAQRDYDDYQRSLANNNGCGCIFAICLIGILISIIANGGI